MRRGACKPYSQPVNHAAPLPPSPSEPSPPRLPAAPSLATHPRGAAWLSPDGEIEALSHVEAARRAKGSAPLLVHRNAVAARLKVDPFAAYDLLELYAFVRAFSSTSVRYFSESCFQRSAFLIARSRAAGGKTA